MADMFQVLTGEHSVGAPPELMVSKTLLIDEIEQRANHSLETVGYGRNVNSIDREDLGAVHRIAFQEARDARTVREAMRSHKDLLENLSDIGFGWTDIARMLGVSVPALRRWRLGDRPSPNHFYHISALVAFVEMIKEAQVMADLVSWMEMPLDDGCSLSCIDIYAKGEHMAIYELASGHTTPIQVLDLVDPEWRVNYSSDFEVFQDYDGELGIRRKVVRR